MDHARKKILVSKVSKLLAKAQTTNFEAEAQTFLAKAQEILAENGLSMAEIEALSEEQQRAMVTSSEPYVMGKHVIDWKGRLAQVIAHNFRCLIFYGYKWDRAAGRNDRTIVMMGMGEDVAVARDVFVAAVDVVERLSKAYVASVSEEDRAMVSLNRKRRDYWGDWEDHSERGAAIAVSRKLRTAWIGGFISGLAQKFEEQKRALPSMALVLVVHPMVRERYQAEITGKPHRSTVDYRGSHEARAAGFQAGKRFDASPRAGSSRARQIASPRS
jgi:hypothetical protein